MTLKELFDKTKRYVKYTLPIVVLTYLIVYALFNGFIMELVNLIAKFYMDALSFIPNEYVRVVIALVLIFWAIKACYTKLVVSIQKDMTKVAEQEDKTK